MTETLQSLIATLRLAAEDDRKRPRGYSSVATRKFKTSLADTLERIDDEHLKLIGSLEVSNSAKYDALLECGEEIAQLSERHGSLRRSLIRACNATDGGCAYTVSDGFLANVGEEVELTIKELRERLAVAEKYANRYRWLRDSSGPDSESQIFVGRPFPGATAMADELLEGDQLDAEIDAAIAEDAAIAAEANP